MFNNINNAIKWLSGTVGLFDLATLNRTQKNIMLKLVKVDNPIIKIMNIKTKFKQGIMLKKINMIF